MQEFRAKIKEWSDALDTSILHALRGGPLSVSVLSRELGISHHTIKKHVQALVASGRVHERKVQHLRLYSLFEGATEQRG